MSRINNEPIKKSITHKASLLFLSFKGVKALYIKTKQRGVNAPFLAAKTCQRLNVECGNRKA